MTRGWSWNIQAKSPKTRHGTTTIIPKDLGSWRICRSSRPAVAQTRFNPDPLMVSGAGGVGRAGRRRVWREDGLDAR
jgi:hypothetical protein